MNILILEDNADRIELFKRVFKSNQLTIVDSVTTAKLCCANYTFDILFLDHDLGPSPIDGLLEGNTGYDLVKFLIEQGLQKTAIVYVHSMNPAGANVMLNSLLDAKYEAIWLPFTNLMLELTLREKHE